MEAAVLAPQSADRAAVALKAWTRIAAQWNLTLAEAAALADMSESTWKRAKKPGFAGDLTRDQMLRLSALVGIYKALELYFGDDNRAPLDDAAEWRAAVRRRAAGGHDDRRWPAAVPARAQLPRCASGRGVRVRAVSDRALVRLIPATYHKPPALRGLVDSDDEMEVLAEIEGMTSARLRRGAGAEPAYRPARAGLGAAAGRSGGLWPRACQRGLHLYARGRQPLQ